MTQVLAGLIGGLLALAGGVLVTYLNNRRTRAERLTAVGATYLAAGAALYLHLSDVKDETEVREDDPAFRESFTVMTKAGYELMFTASPRVVLLAQDLQRLGQLLIVHALPDTPKEVWQQLSIEFGSVRLELQHAIRAELGHKPMTDDELGSTPPPSEGDPREWDPAS